MNRIYVYASTTFVLLEIAGSLVLRPNTKICSYYTIHLSSWLDISALAASCCQRRLLNMTAKGFFFPSPPNEAADRADLQIMSPPGSDDRMTNRRCPCLSVAGIDCSNSGATFAFYCILLSFAQLISFRSLSGKALYDQDCL